jgi:hypothetical protein
MRIRAEGTETEIAAAIERLATVLDDTAATRCRRPAARSLCA